jgi:hypothetical protein
VKTSNWKGARRTQQQKALVIGRQKGKRVQGKIHGAGIQEKSKNEHPTFK